MATLSKERQKALAKLQTSMTMCWKSFVQFLLKVQTNCAGFDIVVQLHFLQALV